MNLTKRQPTLYPLRYGLLVLLLLGAAACGGGATPQNDAGTPAEPQAAGLSQEQMEKGIGPIKDVELSASIDAALAAQGGEIFATKCAACHKLDQRYVGPELGQVLSRRQPEYVMNMILNSEEMVQQHPTAKALLAQFLTPMPNQHLTEADARAVLEYLRDNQSEAAGASE